MLDEIILACIDTDNIFVIDGSDNYLRTFYMQYDYPTFWLFGNQLDLCCGDVDEDYLDEIIVLNCLNYKVYIFDEDDNLLVPPWNINVPDTKYSPVEIACGDFQGKGDESIIVATRYKLDYHFWVFNEEGKQLFDFTINDAYIRDIKCGDINGDGIDEILIGDWKSGHIFVYHRDKKISTLDCGDGLDHNDDETAYDIFSCGNLYDISPEEEIFIAEAHGSHDYIWYDGTIFDQFETKYINWGISLFDEIDCEISCGKIKEIDDWDEVVVVVDNIIWHGGCAYQFIHNYWESQDTGKNIYTITVGDCCVQEGENHPPCRPTINGPQEVLPNTKYTYTIKARDVDGNKVQYIYDWGAGQMHTGDYPSDQPVYIDLQWPKKGLFYLIVEAVDTHGEISKPAELLVTCPKNKLTDMPLLYQLLQRFLKL
jgi:hypothetical protein